MNEIALMIIVGTWLTIRALMLWHEIDEHDKNGWTHIAWAFLLTAGAGLAWYRLLTGAGA